MLSCTNCKFLCKVFDTKEATNLLVNCSRNEFPPRDLLNSLPLPPAPPFIGRNP